MLKRILKQKRYFKNIYKAQHGITGLETAIILIAFVVVAAVFAYTVLSAGLFSTQKSQEAVYNGLQETQNTLEVKGAVLAQASKFQNTCEVAADFAVNAAGGTSMTVTNTAANIHEGDGAIDALVKATGVANDEIGASSATTTVAVGDTITFWAQLGDATLQSKVNFGLHTATDLSAGTDNILISATDTVWHKYTITATVGGAMYYGLYLVGAGVAQHVYIDDIRINNASEWQTTDDWTPYASDIIMVLSLATGGQAVDFTAGTDTNANGLFDDANKTNKIVVNYNDAYQHFADVGWTGTFIGNNNGDSMLDPGEKIQVTISLDAVNAGSAGAYPVDVNHQFTLELKTPKGAILSLQRTMPARLYGINNLN